MRLATEKPAFTIEGRVLDRKSGSELPDFLATYALLAETLNRWKMERTATKLFCAIGLALLVGIGAPRAGSTGEMQGLYDVGGILIVLAILVQCMRKKGTRELSQAVSTYDWFAQVISSVQRTGWHEKDAPANYARLHKNEQKKGVISTLNTLALRHRTAEISYMANRDESRRLMTNSAGELFRNMHATAILYGMISEGWDRFYRWADDQLAQGSQPSGDGGPPAPAAEDLPSGIDTHA